MFRSKRTEFSTRGEKRKMTQLLRLGSLARLLCVVLVLTVIGVSNSGCMVATRQPTISQADLLDERRTQVARVEQRLRQGTARVADAAWPILASNVFLCGNSVEHRTGLWIAQPTKIVHTMLGIGKETNTTIGEQAKVWAIAHDSPAAAADVSIGDVVLRVNGQAVDDSNEARRLLRRVMKRHGGDAVEIELARGSDEHIVRVTPAMTCRSQIRVISESSVNAFANGRTIAIHTGLLQFLPDKRDLQLVIAHELAHNVGNHVPQARIRAAAGGLLDVAVAKFGRVWSGGLFTQLGAISFSKRYEREADYLAMYYMANADVDLSNVEEVWRRLSELDVRFIAFGVTHPSAPERYVALRKTREEIEAKRAAGSPLVPERR